MNLVRFGLTLFAALLLGGGYAASQYAYFNGRAAEFAAQMDQPAIRWLATLLLIAAIALVFVKDKEIAE